MIDTGDVITAFILLTGMLFYVMRLDAKIDRLDRFVAKVARKVNET